MLCTVLSCHIGHGMTRTNQKCNSHLQSMSHVTWIKLNAFIFEALRIETECVAVRFHVQLLHMHKSGQRTSRTRQAVGFCTEKCVMLVRKPRNHSCFVCNFAFVLHGFFLQVFPCLPPIFCVRPCSSVVQKVDAAPKCFVFQTLFEAGVKAMLLLLDLGFTGEHFPLDLGILGSFPL